MQEYNQKIRGHYEIDLHRDGKIIKINKENHLTYQGMSYLFQHLFQPYPCSQTINTPPLSFSVGAFIKTTSVSNNDTPQIHPTWQLSPIFNTNPQTWIPDYPANGKITNSEPVHFQPTIEGSISGFAIFGDEVFLDGGSHNASILWSILEFTQPVSILATDFISVIYSIGLTHVVPYNDDITAFRPSGLDFPKFGT